MIIFLHGEDSYRSRQKLKEIINQYKHLKKSVLNLLSLDAKEIEFTDFYDHLKISPMFAENKLVVLKNIFSEKKFQEDFLAHLENINSLKDIIVVYEKEVVDQRLKLFRELTRQCKSQEFQLLEGKKAKDFIVKEFERNHAKITLDATTTFLTYVGNDLWRASSEMKKLINFKQGEVIKKEDVALLVAPKIEADIFKTIDALAQKNKKEAFLLIKKHLDNGESPLYILSMIAYQFRNLMMVKELSERGLMYASIVKKSGLHPFVVKKNYFWANRFSREELRSIYYRIFETDSNIKSGNIEPETGLSLLVSKI